MNDRQLFVVVFVFTFAANFLVAFPCACSAADPEHELFYNRPAEKWTEALPLGNGRLGCMVFGGVAEARFQFNEDTLWTGEPHDYAHEGAVEHLAEIRRLLFAGRQKQAEKLAMKEFMSVPLKQCAYQPFGDITLRHQTKGGNRLGEVKNYRRTLDLKTATTFTSYEIDGVQYTRQTIISFPDQVIAIHVTCSQPGLLNLEATLTTPHTAANTTRGEGDTIVLTGRVNDMVHRNKEVVKGRMQFASHLQVSSPDGKIEATDESLTVSNASAATFLLSAATNFVNYRDLSADPVSRSSGQLSAARKSWPELLDAHIEDHRELYDRVSLRLGTSIGPSDVPTDERILKNAELTEPSLSTLLFNYGRYLMIASSRPGSQPANLQGIWNDNMNPPWESKYTCNINTEMNYWLVEACNLSECAQPLFKAIEEMTETGKSTAREQYGAPGWVLHHNFDIWRGTAPINHANHGIWPTGGAWLCQHLWEHYLYNGDQEFLREKAYPAMKGAAEFFADYLIEDPRSDQKWLISGPSNSPEIGGLVMGPTMDHQIIRNLFAITITAAKALGVDHEFSQELELLRTRIAPNQIGQHGQLQEWLEDVDDPKEKHRHVSHLWGLHPGNEITPDTPDLLSAARQSLEFRGPGRTGWSRAWKINFRARLRDADRAEGMLQGLLKLTNSRLTKHRGGGVYPNLFDAHPPFQIDGNFGATNGICEMLVQSHRQTSDGKHLIVLLPALPAAWPDGSISGLRSRAGFELDLAWSAGKLTSCQITSLLGTPAVLCYHDNRLDLELAADETGDLDGQLRAK